MTGIKWVRKKINVSPTDYLQMFEVMKKKPLKYGFLNYHFPSYKLDDTLIYNGVFKLQEGVLVEVYVKYVPEEITHEFIKTIDGKWKIIKVTNSTCKT